ncbi:hypothetical protein EDC04DRAFT_2604991 [Pisolithus marmoratus]|nr:hypothetical protein EDC04DRAFT_2604991 [Pisolithus marmoratus]
MVSNLITSFSCILKSQKRPYQTLGLYGQVPVDLFSTIGQLRDLKSKVLDTVPYGHDPRSTSKPLARSRAQLPYSRRNEGWTEAVNLQPSPSHARWQDNEGFCREKPVVFEKVMRVLRNGVMHVFGEWRKLNSEPFIATVIVLTNEMAGSFKFLES